MPKINAKGLALIKGFEGLRLKAYLCPAGVWTIGYGTTRGVIKGMEITELEAEMLVKADLKIFEEGVTKLTKTVKLTPNQFSALVSFAYNLGLTALKNSTLLKVVLKDTYSPEVRTQFMRWVRAAGKILPGLIRRRDSEADLYFLQ